MKNLCALFILFTITQARSQFFEDFESVPFSTIPVGWLASDNQGGTIPNWRSQPLAWQGYQSLHCAYIDRDNVGPGNISEEWLTTPAIAVAPNANLSFFSQQMIGGNQNTLYEVRVSTTSQSDHNTFVQFAMWDEIQISPGLQFRQQFLSLAAYSGQTVYLAFIKKHLQQGATLEGDRWLLDNVSVGPPQIINIPDANFKNRLVHTNCAGDSADLHDVDTNNDNEIDEAEAMAVVLLHVDNANIGSITGIEYFQHLSMLSCTGNNIHTLDLSVLPNVRSVYCSNNQMTAINLANTNFMALDCSHNLLTSIDFNAQIDDFDFGDLDVSYNLLTSFSLPASMQKFDYLVVSGNPFTTLTIPSASIQYRFVCKNMPNLVALDLSEVTYFASWAVPVIEDNPNLRSINMSNLSREFGFYNADSSSVNYWINGNPISNCPALQFICVDDFEVDAVAQYFAGTGVAYASDCSQMAVADFTASAYTIYPNPVKNNLNIEAYGTASIQSMQIYNMLGQLLQSIPNSNTEKSIAIDVSQLESGTYFIEITSDKGKTTRKFIKL
jgi:hypothetical protein